MVKTISYNELNRRISEIERVKKLGVELIHKKDMVKVVFGGVLVVVGIVTLPIPTGSLLFISVGLSLIANGGVNLISKDRIIRKFRMWVLKWV